MLQIIDITKYYKLKKELKSKKFKVSYYEFNDDYLNVCKKLGITSFRGNEKSQIYESSNGENQTLIKKIQIRN